MSKKNDNSPLPRSPAPVGFMRQGEVDELVCFIDEDEAKEACAVSEPWSILIVDDEAMVHESTLLALKYSRFAGRACTFFHAYSAAEALALIIARRIDLVFLDVVMETPHAGLELLCHLRRESIRPNMKIVLRSGQPGQLSEIRVMREYPVDGYIQKNRQSYGLLHDTLSSLLGGDGHDKAGLVS